MKFRMSLICNFARGYFICQFLKHLTEDESGFPVLSPLILCVIWYVSLIFTNIHHFSLVPVCNGAKFKLAFLCLRWLVAALTLEAGVRCQASLFVICSGQSGCSFSEYDHFPLSVSFCQCSILICICIREAA